VTPSATPPPFVSDAIAEFRRQHCGLDPKVIWITRKAVVVVIKQTGAGPFIPPTIPVRFCDEAPPLVEAGRGSAIVLFLKDLPGDRQGVVAAETDSVPP